MAKRETREEKAARFVVEARQRDVDEIKQRAAKARSLTPYTEKAAWELLAAGDKSLGTLWELVRMFDAANDDLRRRIESLASEMADALLRHANGRRFVFGGSYAIGSTGADIERLDAKRLALADAIAMTARATGWWVPQVYDSHERERHARLSTLEVVERNDGTMFCIMCEGKALTGVDLRLQPADAAAPLASEYTSADAAWLAAAAYVGR
jgi:hypothetical protein